MDARNHPLTLAILKSVLNTGSEARKLQSKLIGKSGKMLKRNLTKKEEDIFGAAFTNFIDRLKPAS